MGDPRLRREAVHELEYMMPTYACDHNHIVHDADLPLPNFIQDINFHAIILGPTFLCSRFNQRRYAEVINLYDFIRCSNAFKIALPQDDYDCSSILDRWMVNWNVNLLFTVCPEHWSVLYPEYIKKGPIKLGYTGYISDKWISDWKFPKNFESRTIDVSYRASRLPANFGSIGNLKSKIAEQFVRAVAGKGLHLDISTSYNDLIPGSKWHEFLENSKFCLTTNSGSSLLDPEGLFRQAVHDYSNKNPYAPFKKIAQACFPGEDGKYIFSAISPRNLEAALACTVQIATPGSYSDLMKPMEHYIPLNKDCSNISDVLRMMKDKTLVQHIRRNCKELMLSVPELRFNYHVNKLIYFIENHVNSTKMNTTSQEKMNYYLKRYRSEVESKANFFWTKQRIIQKIDNIAKQFDIHKINNWLLSKKKQKNSLEQ